MDLFGKAQQYEANEKPDKLTPTSEQREAIDHVDGPMLVVAGAGTGKTTVLASRVVRLIEEGLAEPREILAVTYTRNSASDLLKRIARLWKGSDDPATVSQVADSGLKVGTFHAYCYLLLRNAGQRFDLIDDQDLYVLLRRRIEDLKLQYYVKAATPGQFLEGLTKFFKRCHDELKTPDDYDAYVAKLESKQIPLPRVSRSKDAEAMPEDEVLGRCREIARVFRHVEDMLAAENLGTYSHVITRAIALLRGDECAEHLERARQGARFVLIDEFQDSNVGQIELTRLLAGETANVFAVGDPDQAIYRFRGATAGTFDHFLRTFGVDRVKRVTMSENRRSTDFILRSAYSVIERNPEITSVELPGGERWVRAPLQHSRTKAEPNPVPLVQIRGWDDTATEASFVAREIVRLREETGRPWRDFAVLYRNHRNRNELVEPVDRTRSSFQRDGPRRVADPRSARRACRIARSSGGRRCGAAACGGIAQVPGGWSGASHSAGHGGRMPAGAGVGAGCGRCGSHHRAGGGAAQGATDAEPGTGRVRHRAAAVRHSAFGERRRVHGVCAVVEPQAAPDCRRWHLKRISRLPGVFHRGGRASCAPEEVQDDTPAALQMELGQTSASQANDDDAVQLLTVHAAKGLEFPVVFVLRVTNPSFPSSYRKTCRVS